MYKHKLHQALTPKIIFNWFLMSFNAGSINAGGLLSTGRFVSHVTGFSTIFGVDLVKKNYHEAFGIFFIPLFFLTGAFVSGLLIDRPIYHKQKPHFDYVMAISGFCLLLAGFGNHLFDFGSFGQANLIHENFILLALICGACGLQNAALTTSSGTSVRTTHLTGLTTDLGLGLAKILTIKPTDPGHRTEMRSNVLRAGTIFSFIIGSTFGAWLFLRFEYHGFLLCGLISLYASWIGRKEKQAAHQIHSLEP